MRFSMWVSIECKNHKKQDSELFERRTKSPIWAWSKGHKKVNFFENDNDPGKKDKFANTWAKTYFAIGASQLKTYRK